MFSTPTLKFALGRRLITITIPPFVILLVLLAAGSGYGVASLRQQSLNRELESLRESNERLEHSLYKERAELKRVGALAEVRSQELWGELERRRAEAAQLWGMLGQLQGRPQNRRPTLASRSGRRLPLRGLHSQYSDLQEQVKVSGAELELLRLASLRYRQSQREAAEARRSRCTPAGVPCEGEMSSPFGPRVHPIYGVGRPHNGCDFTTDHGTDIHVTADGAVVSCDWKGGYGQTVEIDHGYGLHTLYAHCSQIKVKKGQQVRRGQSIASVGMTGLASGPHCHYEVHQDGNPVDPETYLSVAPAPPRPWHARVATWSQVLLDSLRPI